MAANLDSSYTPKEIRDVPVDPSAASKILFDCVSNTVASPFHEKDKLLMTEFASGQPERCSQNSLSFS